MRSAFFQEHGLVDTDYDFDGGKHPTFDFPVVNFRAPGCGLQMLDLTGVSQLRQKFEYAKETEAVALFDHLIRDCQRPATNYAPLYVDASRAAQLEHGAMRPVPCPTLAEAKMAWDRLAADRKEIAVIKSAGRIYDREQIERFHYQRKA